MSLSSWPAAALLLLTVAACTGSPGPEARGRVAAAPADTTLEGGFRWMTLADRTKPVEFPPGSGATLLDGTLELRVEDVAGPRGRRRFGMRFTAKTSAADSARVTGEDGNWVVRTDSLLFTPDGREDRPPVRFRYAWRRDGVLELTDSQGNVWGYVRR